MNLRLDEEIKSFLVKIIVPAFVAISVKLALESKRQKVSLMHVLTSIVIGIGSAYVSADWVLGNFKSEVVPIVIATITITGEKIGYWLMDRFDLAGVLDGLVRLFLDKFKK